MIEEGYLNGSIEHATSFLKNKQAWSHVRWIPQGWKWVDPLKEVKASQVAMEIGISSLADECASQGKDWEEVVDQLKREKVTIKEAEEANDIVIIGDEPKVIETPEKKEDEEDE